jgi:hypothetical protein
MAKRLLSSDNKVTRTASGLWVLYDHESERSALMRRLHVRKSKRQHSNAGDEEHAAPTFK